MGRADEIKARYERQSQKIGMPSSMPGGASPAGRQEGYSNRRPGPGRIGLLLLLLLILGGGLAALLLSRGGVQTEGTLSADGLTGTGSGFFISEDGWFITAAHVVAGAQEVRLLVRGESIPAAVIRVDHANDVALLKAEGRFAALPLADGQGLKLGDAVFTIGFPMPGLQGQSPKLTRGDISSMAGLQDDPRHFQVSIPVQPGNSGGPLCSADGSVQGVIVSRINDEIVMQSSGVVPQNINYALKNAYLLPLLSPQPGAGALKVGSRPPSSTPAVAVEAAVAIVASFGQQ